MEIDIVIEMEQRLVTFGIKIQRAKISFEQPSFDPQIDLTTDAAEV